MIRVLIVDDQEILRSGLGSLFATAGDVEIVGEAQNGRDALLRASELQPDVVLMDLDMPVMDGVEATALLHEAQPGAQIVILTAFSDRARILGAIEAGAVGYLLKDADPDEVLRGVREAVAGGSPLAPKAARTVLEAHTLREREREDD